MNDWYFFVLQAVVGNLRASRNLESRARGLTEKNIYRLYISSVL